MRNTNEIVDFFREVQRAIERYGLDAVLNKLREIHNYNSQGDYNKGVLEYILLITSHFYKVPKEDILRSKKRGVISESRRMCFALIKEHLPFSDQEIGDIFDGRSRQYVNKELLELPINQDEFTTNDEAKFMQDFMELTVSVLLFKTTLNKQQQP